MPNYDFRCTGCGHKFEHTQSMSCNTTPPCPECQKNLNQDVETLKLITGGTFHLKGSGWYNTDYKGKS
jgi:putative FmdB family regulatory protein